MKRHSGIPLLAAMVVAGLSISAHSLTIEAGTDYHMTVEGTQLDLTAFGLPIGMVDFLGNPVDPNGTDTIIERQEDAGLPGDGTSDTIDIELVELSLQSVAPVQISSSFFDVFVELGPGPPSAVDPNTGEMTIELDDESAGTGTFDSFFDIFVELTLVDVSDPLNTLTLMNNEAFQLHMAGNWSTTPDPLTMLVQGPPGDGSANTHFFLPDGTEDFYPQETIDGTIDGVGTHDTQLTPVIPEPATWSLLGLGMAGLFVRRRFRA